MTAADAQAFKRACAVFGLGRYFYDFNPPWVDLDQNRQPPEDAAAIGLGDSGELAQRDAASGKERQ